MGLAHVTVTAVRNLSEVQLVPAAGLNLIAGVNGSGKTSLLEALYLLGRARSFRTREARQLVQSGKTETTVFGRLSDANATRIGVRKTIGGETEVRIDGQRLRAAGELAQRLPMQVMEPGIQALVAGPAALRRSYMDWTLFHVEQGYWQHWQRYQKALLQRNAALQASMSDRLVSSWHEELVTHGEALSKSRRTYLEQLSPVLHDIYASLGGDAEQGIRLRLRQGWPEGESLAERLARGVVSDRQVKYTRAGPHRADFVLSDPDGLAVELWSRGQQKRLAYALVLAQLKHFHAVSDRRCVVLIDDINAELDRDNAARILAMLYRMDSQVFVTTTDMQFATEAEFADTRVFHVERGQVREMV